MILDRKGVTRLVLIFKNFVVKVPNFTYSHNHFLQGCAANWQERYYYKKIAKYVDNPPVSPSYFCSWFGLIQIQAKCEPLNRYLTRKEEKYFKEICNGDIKKENFGYYKNELVCLDYP